MENQIFNVEDFELIKMRGDGNCLFRAMSYAIYKTDIYHKHMRQEIVNYVKHNWETQKESIQNVHQINSKENYCNFMLKSTGTQVTYGTEYEILIFSYIQRKPVIILKKTDNQEMSYCKLFQTNDANNNHNTETSYIHFLHSGKDITGHYDVLLLKKLSFNDLTQLTKQFANTQLASNKTPYTYTTQSTKTTNYCITETFPINNSKKRKNDILDQDTIVKNKKNTINKLQSIEKKCDNTDGNSTKKKIIIKEADKYDTYITSSINGTQKNYNIDNFKLITITEDSNSLFRAMSYANHITENYHELMRYEIVNYVKHNWETEKESIKNVHKLTNKEDYYDYMFKSAKEYLTNGTKYEILIFSYIYKKSIILLQKNIDQTMFYQQIFKTNNVHNDTDANIYFLFSNNADNKTVHYNVLLPTKVNFSLSNLTNQLTNTKISNQLTTITEIIAKTSNDMNENIDQNLRIDNSINDIFNKIEPITVSTVRKTNTLLSNSVEKKTNYKPRRKCHVYSVKKIKYTKNYMRNYRNSDENKTKEYKKYNEVYIKNYLQNNNLSDLRKQTTKREMQKYRQNNKNKYRLEKLKNKKRLRNLRKNPEFKNKEYLKNAKKMSHLRNTNNEMLKNDLIRIKQLRRNPSFKLNELLRDKIYKKNIRKNQTFKRKESLMNLNRMQNLRLYDENYKMEEHKKNLLRIRNIRMNKTKYKLRRYKNMCDSIKILRKNKLLLRKQQRIKKLFQSLNVLNNNTNDSYNLINRPHFIKSIEKYIKAIKEGPTWICSSCGGLWFRKSITIYTEKSMLKHKNLTTNWNEICQIKINDNIVLCSTCKNGIFNNRIPKLALINGLQFPEIPEVLQNLTPLEERLISPRLPFMQIRHLGIDKQFGLHGNCVNVPTDVDNNVSILPRTIDNIQTVQIQLMRRMTDKNPYSFETIRPRKVYVAADYLTKQPLYQIHNIILSYNWFEEQNNNEINTTNDIHDDVTKRNLIIKLNNDDTNLEIDNWDETVHDEPVNPINEETLLLDEFVAIKFAPGEKKQPISLLMDEDLEELAFPTIYCGHRRTLKTKISLTQIAKSEARMFDRRCALNIPKLMLSHCRTRLSKLVSNIQINLRKKCLKTNTVTVQNVLNNDTLNNIIQHNDGYRILQVDRSSPAFWEQNKKNVFSMMRQLGMPHIFLTVSAAEMRWTELIITLKKVLEKVDISVEECNQLTWQAKMKLIQNDPITCARYYNYRIQELFKLLKCKNGIFDEYDLEDYYYRVEFQHRGSPHVHCMLWLKNGPHFIRQNPNSIQKCEEFIDKFIQVYKDPEISDLINYQVHKHNATCKKRDFGVDDDYCRFGFPQLPMLSTKILLPKCSKILRKNTKIYIQQKWLLIKKTIDLIEKKKMYVFNTFCQQMIFLITFK